MYFLKLFINLKCLIHFQLYFLHLEAYSITLLYFLHGELFLTIHQINAISSLAFFFFNSLLKNLSNSESDDTLTIYWKHPVITFGCCVFTFIIASERSKNLLDCLKLSSLFYHFIYFSIVCLYYFNYLYLCHFLSIQWLHFYF